MSTLLTLFIFSRIIGIITAITVGIVVIKRYLEFRIKITLLLLSISLGYGLLCLIQLLPNLIRTSEILKISTILAPIGSALFFISILLFFNYFSGSNSVARVGVAAGATTGMIILEIVTFVTGLSYLVGEVFIFDDLIIVDWSGFAALILLPTFALTTYWIYTDLRKTKKNLINIDQKNQIRMMSYGFYLIFFVGIIFNIIGGILLMIDRIYYLFLIHFGLLGISIPIGFLLISISYLKFKQVAFLQPVSVDNLIIIHRTGIPLFEYKFKENTMSAEVELVSGAIHAISAIMAEAFNTTSEIDNIRFKDKNLLLEFTEQTAIVLITEKETNFLRRSLIRFKNNFNAQYEESIDKFTGDTSHFENVSKLVEYDFGLSTT
jgi:hypothetical protein